MQSDFGVFCSRMRYVYFARHLSVTLFNFTDSVVVQGNDFDGTARMYSLILVFPVRIFWAVPIINIDINNIFLSYYYYYYVIFIYLFIFYRFID